MKAHFRNNPVNSPVAIAKILVLAVALLGSATPGISQAEEASPEKDTRPVKNMFESVWLIDHHTVVVPIKGTFEFDMQHRFGTWNQGYSDFYGVFAASNIRLGVDYVPMDKLMLGLGFTKDNLLWDGYAKYAILQQGRKGGSPVSLTYYVNAAVDTRKEEKTTFTEGSDRWSFFHEVMIARKVTKSLSVQAGINLAWFNHKEQVYDSEGIDLGRDNNGQFSANFMARYKITNTLGVIAAYDLPITDQPYNDPEPNLSFGLEMVSSSHAFQIFIGNYNGLVPQYNTSFNSNSFGDNDILIGFNITRLWNF